MALPSSLRSQEQGSRSEKSSNIELIAYGASEQVSFKTCYIYSVIFSHNVTSRLFFKQYNTVTENTIIDIENEGVNLTSYASGDKERVESFTEDFISVENNEAYSKYEGLVNPTETEYAGRPAYNKVTDNILVNSEVVFTSENIKYFGVVENNTEASVNEYGFAVDCENPQILSQKNFDVNNFGIEEKVNRNINVNVVQKNNSYTFDVEDSLKIGSYELYIENEKVAEFSDSVTLKTLPSYGEVSIKVVPVSKGLKVKSNAFMGKENALNMYETAVKEKYRFFSFGDCMLII